MNLTFNPATKGVPTVAKFWELLRRNPNFRKDLRLIIAAKNNDFTTDVTREELENFLFDLDMYNPLAALAFRWVFPETRFSFGKTPPGNDETELIARYLPYLSIHQVNDALLKLRQKHSKDLENDAEDTFCAIDELYQTLPFMLNRGLTWTRNSSLGLGTYVPKETAPLPLLGTSTFSENTSWPNTPKTFQEQFEWLWAFRYDYSAVSPFTKDRTLLPRMGFPYLLAQICDQCSYFCDECGLRMKYQLEHLMDTHVIVAIPRLRVTEADLATVTELVKDGLRPFIVHGNGEFLGGEAAWEVFIQVMKSREYMPLKEDEPSKMGKLGTVREWQTTGSGVALEVLLGKYGVKMRTHLQQRLKYMEKLMSQIYPQLYKVASTQSTANEESSHYVIFPFVFDTDPVSD